MNPILGFLIILSILVLVHELGHFLMARLFKIRVEEFGLGYPPRILGKKIGETFYSLNLLPFGGFVRMLGEDPSTSLRASSAEAKRAFYLKPKGVRVAVLLAGVAMNFLLGIGLFAAIYTKIGIPEKVDYLKVTHVSSGSPAESAGLKPDDKIVNFTDSQKFIEFVNLNRGQEITLDLNDSRQIKVIPRLVGETPAGEGALGVGITNQDLVMYPTWQRPLRGMVVGVQEALNWGKEIGVSLGITIRDLFRGKVPQEVAGPIGIYEISKGVAAEGFLATLQFVAILSINLSILNLLPLPALDGGRLFFIGLELVFRKKLKPQVEQTIHLIGMMLLLGLMALVTINDIKRLLG